MLTKLLNASSKHSLRSLHILSSSSSSIAIFKTSGSFDISVALSPLAMLFSFANSSNSFIYNLAISLFINIFFPSMPLFMYVINTSIFPLEILLDMLFLTLSSIQNKFLGSLIFISKYLWFTDFISTIYSLLSFCSFALPYPVMLFIFHFRPSKYTFLFIFFIIFIYYFFHSIHKIFFLIYFVYRYTLNYIINSKY